MNPTTPEEDARLAEIESRIAAAVHEAQHAFWATFAAAFPEVKTGDMYPEQVKAFEDATEEAAREWLLNNDFQRSH